MSNLTRAMMMGAAGASGDKIYVDDVFSTFIYDGNSGTQSINNGIDLSGEGGLIWIKTRNDNSYHFLTDTARGVNKHIASNSVDPEGNVTAITAFNSNGFSLANQANVNQNYNYVSWTFRKAPGFFDVVTYSGNSTAGRQVAHSLGSVPGMILIKILNEDKDWFVYHRSLGATKNLRLNETDAVRTTTNVFNNTEPTSTHFTLGNESDVNGTGKNFVAYIFAHDEQSFGTDSDESIIKCGTYAGSGSTQNISLGFEAQWVMFKNITTSGDWKMGDIMRGMTDDSSQVFDANAGGAEGAAAWNFAPYSDGFTIGTNLSSINQSGQTYIYMAIRRPNKPPEAATEVFHINYLASNGKDIKQTTGFPIDLLLYHYGDAVNVIDRLRGLNRLRTPYNYADGGYSPDALDYSDGFKNEAFNGSVSLGYSFRRAPGFFDMVTYSGNASNQNINHNLEVAPEFYIVKRRNATEDWATYHASLGAGKYTKLNNETASYTNTTIWNNTSPTSSVFTVGNDVSVNGNSNDTYVAYLFATLPGISKVGSFTGTGSAVNVDCGFTSGARFVLIRRSDIEIGGSIPTSWFVWDSVRGIVSGDDPYILLNSAVAQVTNTNYVNPLSTGFTVNASAPDALNASGGTYIFLAIA